MLQQQQLLLVGRASVLKVTGLQRNRWAEGHQGPGQLAAADVQSARVGTQLAAGAQRSYRSSRVGYKGIITCHKSDFTNVNKSN